MFQSLDIIHQSQSNNHQMQYLQEGSHNNRGLDKSLLKYFSTIRHDTAFLIIWEAVPQPTTGITPCSVIRLILWPAAVQQWFCLHVMWAQVNWNQQFIQLLFAEW